MIMTKSDKQRAYIGAWKRANQSKQRGYEQKRLAKPGEKIKLMARAKLNRAVLKGIIKRPTKCSKCGSMRNIEGHHPDYTKPYDVEWLCASCHKRVDK